MDERDYGTLLISAGSNANFNMLSQAVNLDVNEKRDSVRESLLPIAVARNYVLPPHFTHRNNLEIERNVTDQECLILKPASISYELPGSQTIALTESRRIQGVIRNGQSDGLSIVKRESKGSIASHADGCQISSNIRNAITSSVYKDNVHPLFLQTDFVLDSSVENPMVKLSPKRAIVSPATNSKGYETSEYKSIYEGGGTSYNFGHDGYKIGEYKSVYDA